MPFGITGWALPQDGREVGHSSRYEHPMQAPKRRNRSPRGSFALQCGRALTLPTAWRAWGRTSIRGTYIMYFSRDSARIVAFSGISFTYIRRCSSRWLVVTYFQYDLGHSLGRKDPNEVKISSNKASETLELYFSISAPGDDNYGHKEQPPQPRPRP